MTELFLFYGYIFRITDSSQPYFKLNKTYWYRFQVGLIDYIYMYITQIS